ncbi:MAG: ABC transporter permease [Niabella sp.]|nr:ABC transporter permease [Niabella sp.]
MFKNFFVTTFRNMRRSAGTSVINIVGLAMGMAVAMIIGLWIHDELQVNKNFPGHERISQVMLTGTFSGEMETDPGNPAPLAAQLRTDYSSEFKTVSLATHAIPHIFSVGEKKLNATGMFADSYFAGLFSVKPAAGTTNITSANQVLLSQSLARSLFGDANPVGRILKIDSKDLLTVAGVYPDFPKASYFGDVDYLGSWNYYLANNPGADQYWEMCYFYIFTRLTPGTDNAQASHKIANLLKPHLTDINPVFSLHPMDKWHLYETFKNGKNVGGRIQYVWMFGVIGFFVLLLACINFMNLSTARSERRAKEVGVLKTMGVRRSQLIARFIGESILITFGSFLLGIFLVFLSAPLFNRVVGSQIYIPAGSLQFWLMCIGFVVFTGFVAGCYPAFYLSSFKPVKVLKGNIVAGRSAATPRKVLVVLQFLTSIFLIIATTIVLQQLNHARSRPLGYSNKGLINIPVTTDLLRKNYDVLKQDLLQSGFVTRVSLSSQAINAHKGSSGGYKWTGMTAKDGAVCETVNIDEDFSSTVNWKFKLGRNFSKAFPSDSSGIILNEAAVNYMGLKNPVGSSIEVFRQRFHVVGVVQNTISNAPFSSISPAAFFLIGPTRIPAGNITVRLSPVKSARESVAFLKNVFNKYNPDAPFEYYFADQQYAQAFNTVIATGYLGAFATGLALFISCLGLFALASYTAEQRTKELGIRKVLGASVFSIWRLLSKEFILLTGVGFIIAVPLVYWCMSRWLDNYVYRIAISWEVFAFTGIIALLITLLTISFQAIRAAIANPVKALRNE